MNPTTDAPVCWQVRQVAEKRLWKQFVGAAATVSFL
jgi:hypothetical protein